MPKQSSARESIVRAGLDLMLRKGLSASGLVELLRGAKIPKGSFYYHFPGGKDELVLAVIAAYVDASTVAREAILADRSRSALERVRAHFRDLDAAFGERGWAHGCLLGNLAGEAVDELPEVRAAVADGFELWIADLARVLQEAAEHDGVALPASAEVTARMLVSGWEGAALLMKSERSAEALREFDRLWFDTILR